MIVMEQTDAPEISPGKKIRILRNTINLTQNQIADIMQVDRGTVGAYESRTNASPSPDKIRRLVETVGRDHKDRLLAWFYDGASDEPLFLKIPELGGNPSPVKVADEIVKVPLWEPKAGPFGHTYVKSNLLATVARALIGDAPERVIALSIPGLPRIERFPPRSVVFVMMITAVEPSTIVVTDTATGRYLRKVDGDGIIYGFDGARVEDSIEDIVGTAILVASDYESGPNLEWNNGRPLKA